MLPASKLTDDSRPTAPLPVSTLTNVERGICRRCPRQNYCSSTSYHTRYYEYRYLTSRHRPCHTGNSSVWCTVVGGHKPQSVSQQCLRRGRTSSSALHPAARFVTTSPSPPQCSAQTVRVAARFQCTPLASGAVRRRFFVHQLCGLRTM